ncbi:hypothetical protein [Thalassotalea eurytherma]|uniref:Uncharacterized protein n=1 Tax=Thalassotalea eurytherma TaxID=1144278 RepID=A0ABQ6H0Y5_9GAMM|nr:hypothetical protein [Thalassotalea eurytherma]GLX81863.1 hypothetical protein theurythT_13150 [Thalassotalea eurytherma]
MKDEDLKFEIIPSRHGPSLGASVGVRVIYSSMNIAAESTLKKTQYANKVEAIKKLKTLIAKQELE